MPEIMESDPREIRPGVCPDTRREVILYQIAVGAMLLLTGARSVFGVVAETIFLLDYETAFRIRSPVRTAPGT
jgi:hypothetical protein